MPKYAQIADCKDPALKVTDEHLTNADVLVDGDLSSKGIMASEVDQNHAGLRLLAVFYACQLAATDAIKGENSPMVEKARVYERLAKQQAEKITRAWLGLLASGQTSGFGSIKIGRA